MTMHYTQVEFAAIISSSDYGEQPVMLLHGVRIFSDLTHYVLAHLPLAANDPHNCSAGPCAGPFVSLSVRPSSSGLAPVHSLEGGSTRILCLPRRRDGRSFPVFSIAQTYLPLGTDFISR